MAITRVQVASAITPTSAGADHLDCSWSSATTDGNLLIACVAIRTGSVDPRPVTVPSGWQTAIENLPALNACVVGIYYIENAAARTGAETFSWTGTKGAGVVLLEYSGMAASGVLDQVAGSTETGTRSLAKTGTTATTTQADELWLGLLAHDAVGAFGAPSDGFTEVIQVTPQGPTGDPNTPMAVEEFIATATGAASTTATMGGSKVYAGAIATFKAATAPTVPQGTTSLTGSGSPSVAGRKRAQTIAVALFGHGSPASTGARVPPPQGTSALTGSGGPSSTGRKHAVAAATVTGAGAPAHVGRKRALGASQVASNGSPTSTGRKLVGAATDLTGSGSLTSSGVKRAQGTSSLTGHGAPTQTGAGKSSSTARLAGHGAPSTTGRKITRAASALTAAGAPLVTGNKLAVNATRLTGGGTTTATGRKRARATTLLAGHGAPAARAFRTGPPRVDMPAGAELVPRVTAAVLVPYATQAKAVPHATTAGPIPHATVAVADPHVTNLILDDHTTEATADG